MYSQALQGNVHSHPYRQSESGIPGIILINFRTCCTAPGLQGRLLDLAIGRC